MAFERTVGTGLVYEGVDKGATKVMKAVSKEAGKTQSKLAGMGKHVQAMPDAMGKAAAAMMMMQSGMGQMGGKAADAVNKIAALGALIATGGPVGIAIASATVAMAAFFAAYDLATTATRNYESAIRTLNPVIKGMDDRLRQTLDSTRDLRKELKDFGKDTLVILKEQAILDQAGIAANARQIEQDRKRITNLRGIHEQTKLMMGSHAKEVFLREGLGDITQRELVEDIKLAGIQVKNAQEASKIRKARIGDTSIQIELIEKERAAIDKATAAEDRRTAAIQRQEKARRKRDEEYEKQGDLVIAALERDEAAEAAAAKAKVALAESTADRIKALVRGTFEVAKATRALDIQLSEQAANAEMAAAQQKGAAIQAQTQAIMQQSAMAAEGAKDTAEAAEKFAKSAALQVIDILAAKAAAYAMEKAIESYGMPWGAIIGAAAAVAAAGLVLGFKSQLNRGGVVPGSTANNRDTVPAMLTPGEVVMSQTQVGALRALITNLGAPAGTGRQVTERLGAGAPAAPAGGQTLVVQNQFNQMFADHSVNLKAMRRQARTVKQLRRQGMFPGGAEA